MNFHQTVGGQTDRRRDGKWHADAFVQCAPLDEVSVLEGHAKIREGRALVIECPVDQRAQTGGVDRDLGVGDVHPERRRVVEYRYLPWLLRPETAVQPRDFENGVVGHVESDVPHVEAD